MRLMILPAMTVITAIPAGKSLGILEMKFRREQ